MKNPLANKILLVISLLLFSFGVFLKPASRLQNKNSLTNSKTQIEDKVLGVDSSIYISSKQGRVNGGLISQTTLSAPSVDITSYDISGEVEVNLYRSSIEDVFSYLKYDDKGKQVSPSIDTQNLELIQTFKHEVGKNSGESRDLLLPLEGSGIWALRISQGDVSSFAYIIRSDVQGIVQDGEGQFIFWTQKSSSGESVQNATVDTYSFKNQITKLSSVKTNSRGIAKTTLNPDVDVAVVSHGDDIAVIPVNLVYLGSSYDYNRFDKKNLQSRYFVLTDRPIYQPGDRVYFKSIIRNDRDVRYTIPSDIARVDLIEGYGWQNESPMEKKTISISSQGTVDGFFILPESTKPGIHTININRNNTTSSSGWGDADDSISFQVEHYRKPEYTLSISAQKSEAISNEDLSIVVDGSYFSGQPLNGANVSYSISKSIPYQYEYYSYINNTPDDGYRYGYWGGKEFFSGNVKLDERGKGIISIPTKIDDGKDKVFSVEVKYIDETGNPVLARKNILVRSGEFGIYKTDYWRSSAVGKQVSLPVILHKSTDTSVSNKELQAKVTRKYWTKTQEENSKYQKYTENKEDYSDLSAKTNSEGKAEFIFTPDKEGRYELSIKAKDSKGNQISRTFSFWVSNNQGYYYSPNQSNSMISISLDKDEYEPGEAAYLSINSSISGRDVLISLDRRWSNRRYIVSLKEKTAILEIPIEYTDMPNMHISARSFSQEDINYASVEMSVPANQMKTNVSISSDREEYGPGDLVTLEIETKSDSGNPIPSEVAVWAVDKAIYELSEDGTRDIYNAFWQTRRSQTRYGHSLEGIMATAAEAGGCFSSDTKILLPKNMQKEIKDIRPGDKILTKISPHGDDLVEEKVVSVHKEEVDGYLVINQDFKITPNHILYLNNTWARADMIQVGDQLIDSKGQFIEVSSIEWQKQKAVVYNLETSGNHTFIADNIWVHNQKGEGPRSEMDDIAFWRPRVKTDSQGRAVVRFRLPDNLTTWTIQAISSSTKTHVGQTTKDILVTKDVVIRPILPNIIRTGDDITISAIVHNFTETDHTFNTSLNFDGGDNEKEISEKISANSSKIIEWKISPKEEGEESTFIFTTIADENKDLTDSIEVKIPIEKYGFWETDSEFFQIDEEKKQIKYSLYKDADLDKSSISLNISPSLAGTLPSAMEYLIGYPYGCVEQTTSKLVPAILSKKFPQLFGKIIDSYDLDEMISKGIERLYVLQQSDGGWSWWSHNNSDYFVSSYVIEVLLEAKNLGYEVDQKVLNRAQNYFLKEDDGIKTDEVVFKAYGLTLLDHPSSKILLDNLSEQSQDVIAIATMANMKNNYANPQTNGLALLEEKAKQQGNNLYWQKGSISRFGSVNTSTALGLRAFALGDYNQDLSAKAVNYLIKNRNKRYWSNTFATAQISKAILEYSESSKELTPNYQAMVSANQTSILNQRVSSPSYTKDISVDLGGEPQGEIEISKNGEGKLYGVFTTKQFITSNDNDEKNNGLSVKREYINTKGKRYTISTGDVVLVRITISNDGEGEYNYLVINDQLPSGLIPINTTLSNQNDQNSKTNKSYSEEYEYTKNGIIIAAQTPKKSGVYEYKARAISAGKFQTPPTTAELMYSPEIYGRSSSEIVEITKESKIIPGVVIEEELVKLKNKSLFIKIVGPIITLIALLAPVYVIFKRKKVNKIKEENDKTDSNL